MDGNAGWELLDHTGDVGVLVRAGTLPELFETAARAMLDILVEAPSFRPEREHRIEIEAEDREALLVRWLAELLFLHDARRLVFGRFEILDIAATRLHALAWSEPFDPSRHTTRTELKAVTYHQVLVSEDRSGWSARVIFDI